MLKDKRIHIYLWRGLEARTKKLATALTHAGADVTVISFVFDIPPRQEYPFKIEYLLIRDTKQSYNPRRLARIAANILYYRALNNSILKAFECYCHKQYEHHIMRTRPDLAIAINAFTLAGVARGARKARIPFVYESYEFWPDHAYDPVCYLNKKQRAFLAGSERRYADKAARLVTVSDYLAKEYCTDLHLSRMPEVVYNTPMNTAQSVTPPHAPLRVAFVGNIVPERNIEAVVDAVSRLDGVELFVQGEGYHKEKLIDYTLQQKCSDIVHFVDPVPYENLSDSVSAYDVGVISYEVYNRHVEGALPNKFFEYMAGGLAMLLTRTHAFEEFEHIDDFARFIDPTDVSSLTAQLEYLRDNPTVLTQMKTRALEESQRYCGDAAGRHIRKIYEGVCEAR